jgi:hypothetical protein
MYKAMSIIEIVLAALCVWLGVRVFNRRERWAKWTFAAVAATALYVESWIPMARLAQWLEARDLLPGWGGMALAYFYLPIQIAISIVFLIFGFED